jgi:hypothetical protein
MIFGPLQKSAATLTSIKISGNSLTQKCIDSFAQIWKDQNSLQILEMYVLFLSH